MESLFNSLRKYRTRENTDPVENFLTEAFAWLLKSEPKFAHAFVESLGIVEEIGPSASWPGSWSTQCNWSGVFPDMVWESGLDAKCALVFEHKVWSPLHSGQLENYRSYASGEFKGGYKLIIITGNHSQHTQDPDVAICWRDVFLSVENYVKHEGKSSPIVYLFNDFLQLLKEIGLAPHGAFRCEEIVGYASDFSSRMEGLWDSCAKEFKAVYEAKFKDSLFGKCFDSKVQKCSMRDGRIGMQLFDEWRPGLFVGTLLDCAGHGVTSSNSKLGPDCCIIIDFEESFHGSYESDAYSALVESLEQAFKCQPDGWSFYNHLADQDMTDKNLWHPLHIRKPLVEVLSSGLSDSSLQAQALDLAAKLSSPIHLVIDKTDLIKYRSHDFNKGLVALHPEVLCNRLESVFLSNPSLKLKTEIWWRYSKMHYIIKFSDLSGGELGFKLSFGDNELKVRFFSAPNRKVQEMADLIKLNDAQLPIEEQEGEVVSVYRNFESVSMVAVYQVIQQSLRGLGYRGVFPDRLIES
jgi:hypothetical protein